MEAQKNKVSKGIKVKSFSILDFIKTLAALMVATGLSVL
jgi:hypothetical protein